MKGLPIHRRLAFQLAFAVAVLAGSVFGATGFILIRNERQSLTHEFTLRVLSDTRALSVAAASAILRPDPELELHPLVKRTLEDVDDLADLSIIDFEGYYQGHRELGQIGTVAGQIPSGAELALSIGGARVLRDDHFLYVERPLERLGRRVGTLRATVARDHIEEVIAASVRSLLLIGGGGMAIGLVVVLLLVTYRLRPLEPLREAVERIRAGELDTRIEVRDQNELGLLAGHINRMAEGLERAQGERIRQERIERELEIAQQIQSTLLPRKTPRIEGFELAAHYTPALEVSGDLYDVFPGAGGRSVIVVADVSGKGVPGLVVTAMARVILRELAAKHESPAEILRLANAALLGLTPNNMFITLLLGSLEPETGRFVYSSAGHCPPVGFSAGSSNELPAGGKPLGIFPSALFDPSVQDASMVIAPDSGVLLYTDGLAECENEQGEQLGESAICATLEGSTSSKAQVIVEALLDRVEEHRSAHPANDDLTMLVLRRPTPAGVEVMA